MSGDTAVQVIPDAPASSANHTSVHAVWRGDRRYEVGRQGETTILVDGTRADGPGPVDVLLGALGSCSAMDVVDFLEKRRTPVGALEVVVVAERRAAAPRRVLNATLTFHIHGAGIESVHAERAITLAIENYCSVASSLASDIVLHSQLVLNGERHSLERQHVAPVMLATLATS
ncbi:MAG: OsmC family protein [bacterium]